MLDGLCNWAGEGFLTTPEQCPFSADLSTAGSQGRPASEFLHKQVHLSRLVQHGDSSGILQFGPLALPGSIRGALGGCPFTSEHVLQASKTMLFASFEQERGRGHGLLPSPSHSLPFLALGCCPLITWRWLKNASFPGFCCGQAESIDRWGQSLEVTAETAPVPMAQDAHRSLQGHFSGSLCTAKGNSGWLEKSLPTPQAGRAPVGTLWSAVSYIALAVGSGRQAERFLVSLFQGLVECSTPPPGTKGWLWVHPSKGGGVLRFAFAFFPSNIMGRWRDQPSVCLFFILDFNVI